MMQPIQDVYARMNQSVPEPGPVPVVVFPTHEAWHAYLREHSDAPRIRYCKYGCGGVGFFRRDVPFGHPAFGKAFPCACVKERTAEARLQEYRETLSPTEQAFTLDNWVGQDQNALRVAKQAAAQGWGIFVFWGDVGRAKSGLLAGIVNQCLDRGQQASYKVATSLLDDLRGAYETDSFEEEMNALRAVKVLALDELWRYKQTEWAQEKMFQLLDWRYRYWDRCLTVLATNAQPDASDPLWSRFMDARRSTITRVHGDDVRPYAQRA